MLERLHTIAKFFSRLRWVLLSVAIVGLAGFSLSVFESPLLEGRQLMMPSLVALFWGATALCFIALFEEIPTAPPKDASLRQRWSYKLRRGGYWVLGIAMILLSISLLLLSYQLIRAWFML